jgi:SAM-dependent methyltransferase
MKEVAMSFLDRFDTEWGPRLGVRQHSMRKVFEYLEAKRPEGHLIIETGCARTKDNWAGDGQSTYLFDQFAEHCNGQVFSVDISPQACEYARSVAGARTSVFAEDSVAFLKRLGDQLVAAKKPIDLLYLDSFDLDFFNTVPSSAHHLKELCAISPALSAGTLVVVDDSYRLVRCVLSNNGGVTMIGDQGIDGKAKLVAQYFQNIGNPIYFEGYQCGWIVQ